MATTSRLTVPFALLTLFTAFPPPAHARAEPGTPIANVELRTITGGKEKLLSPKARANVFVFFRTGQDRSLDALKQMAQCERELAGKPVYWTAVVSDSEAIADVKAAVAEAGIRMPVLIDEGDRLYDRLGIRLHPMVGIADGKFVLAALEPYRQLQYCDLVMARIRLLLGEGTQAAIDRVLDPPRATMPGDDLPKKAMRDVNMARKLHEIGEFAESVKFAQRALGIAPVAAAYTIMGKSYAKLGKCPDAEKAFASALRLDPKDAEAAAAKGTCR